MSFVDQLVKLPYQDNYVDPEKGSDVTDGSH